MRRFHDDGSFYYKIVDGNLKGKLSAEGLLINGKKLQTHNLENGDKIVFGPGVLAKYDIRNITAIEPMRTDDEQYIFMGLMLFNDE